MNILSARFASRIAILPLLRRPSKAALALHILAIALVTPLIMRLPLRRAEALLTPRSLGRQAAVLPEEELVALVLVVLRAGRPFVRRGCLTRGLTLYYFLRRGGVDVTLHFGIGTVGPENGALGDGFDGHCWLVKNDAPFLETVDPRIQYVEMYAFPYRSGGRPLSSAQPSKESVGA